jgi:hypothetical protein
VIVTTTRLPLWFGQARGAGLASLAMFEEEAGDEETPGFLDRLWDRLFGGITDTRAAFIGFSVILMALALGTAAAERVPAAAGLLGLATCAWLVFGAACAWFVVTQGDAAPAWARSTVAGLTGLGRIIAVTVILSTIVAVVFAIAVLLMSAAMSDRRY